MIVVDNGSHDGSAEIALTCGDERVSLIRNERNLGAPVGRNQGMRAALEAGVDQIYDLDNDLTAAPDAVSRLVAVLERDPRIAMAGSLILYEDKPDVIFSAGQRIDWTQNLVTTVGRDQVDRGQFRDIWDVDYVGSGAMLVRCSYLREHGLFDETMIGYGYEDTEFGYRAKRLSYRVVCCADSKVWHKPFTGIGAYSYRKKYLEARNAVRFIKRCGTVRNWAKYLFYVRQGSVMPRSSRESGAILPGCAARCSASTTACATTTVERSRC